MRLSRILFIAHLVALTFGLGGLLIALPHPELWAGSAFAGDVFNFGMKYAGSLHIWLGALTMLVFGWHTIGPRRTLIFFVVTVILSISSELIGTGTGWPFGNYEYTSGLGYKVLGRVPYTIPLSWFYVGFASYLLATMLTGSRNLRYRALWTIVIGAYLLTVWDLVLDPAMAHESMPIQFWVWFETGPYFGMPVKNFIGWGLTGVLFMAVSRALWRRELSTREFTAGIPFGIYLANMIFAMALSLSVGLWEPAVAAVIFGLLPAALAWRAQPPADRLATSPVSGPRARREAPAEGVAPQVMRGLARAITGRRLVFNVEGLEHLPSTGPVLIAARHYHHFWDGCALLASSPRPLSIMVALDWVSSSTVRRLMEWACRLAGWPVILRAEGLADQKSSAYRPEELSQYVRRGVRDSVHLLRSGGVLVVFPEAYPNIDPHLSPKGEDEDAFLPFRPGFVRLAEIAQRAGATRVAVIPTGLAYEAGSRWRLNLRFGAPLYLDEGVSRVRLAELVEDQVRTLSEPRPQVRPAVAQEVVQS